MRLGLAGPAALACLSGALLFSWWGARSGDELVALLGIVLLAVAAWQPRWALWLCLAGSVFVALQLETGRRLTQGLSGEDLSVDATVVTVTSDAGITRLRLAVQRCQAPSGLPDCRALGDVRVNAYGGANFQPGEQWRLTLRLRPPGGLANPHTFDYASWLWREGLHATGYVRTEPAPLRLAEAEPSLRKIALDRLSEAPLASRTKRWLAALTLGSSDQLTQQDWALLNATGTTHLVVISGLHVGLVASFVLLLLRGALRLLAPRQWRMSPWPWYGAALAVVGYAWLAGMGPPAMRAMVMTLLGLWVLSGRHAPGPWQAWWLALALVVVSDPLVCWRPGLWLSFAAVAWLIVIWQGRSQPRGIKGWCWALLRSQLLLSPVMAAAVLLAFGRLSPAAPLINLVAVPFVSLLLVPLALLGWLCLPLPWLSTLAWQAFETLLEALHGVLVLAHESWPLWEPAAWRIYPLAAWLFLLACCFGLPAISRWLRLGATLLALLIPWWSSTSVMGPDTLRVRVHDVGQGQLVDLQSSNFHMLYDAGPAFQSGFMPLETLWPPGQAFDLALISHADNDHAGGVAALIKQHNVSRFLAPRGEALVAAAGTCSRGQRWRRDGIDYQVLWPPPGTNTLSANDRSCVLLVSVGEQRLLITGDVGRRVERRLISELQGPVTVLIAGHHGSRSSSGVQFVRQLRPRHVIFSAGRTNAFGHPAPPVLRRFRRQQSCLWNTAQDGALTLWLKKGAREEIEPFHPLPGGRKRC